MIWSCTVYHMPSHCTTAIVLFRMISRRIADVPRAGRPSCRCLVSAMYVVLCANSANMVLLRSPKRLPSVNPVLLLPRASHTVRTAALTMWTMLLLIDDIRDRYVLSIPYNVTNKVSDSCRLPCFLHFTTVLAVDFANTCNVLRGMTFEFMAALWPAGK